MTSFWEVEKRRRRLGRNEFPSLLAELVVQGELEDLDQLAIAVADAWTMPDLPLLALPRREWVALFRHVGYLVDSERLEAARPSAPLQLFRAATRYDRRTPGLAWTPDIEQARFFQRYNQRYSPTPLILMRTVASPHQVLARFNLVRKENEYLVSVSNRTVETIST